MNFESIFEMMKSFFLGLIIVITVLAVCFIAYVVWSLIPPVPLIFSSLVNLLYLIGMVVALVLVVYIIGAIAKRPLKNKIANKSFGSDENEVYCKRCGTVLKGGAEFCSNCGAKVER